MASNSELKFLISGDAGGALAALAKFSAGVKDSTSQVEKQFTGMGAVIKNLAAPLAALGAIIGGGAMFKDMVNETKDWTVEAQKLAKTLGTSTEDASAFGVAIKGVHGDADTFQGIVAKMTRSLNTNEDAFHNLGVATRDSNGHLRGSKDILLDTFGALKNMKAGTDANVASTQIFGRNFMEVRKYLGITAEALEEARVKAEKLNLIVGSDSVEAVNAYRKSQEELDLTMKGVKITIGKELMPVLEAFNDDLAQNGPEAVSSLSNAFSGLYQMVNAIRETFRKLWEVITSGISHAMNAVSANVAAAIAIVKEKDKVGALKKIWADYRAKEEQEAATHALTMKSIEDDYTESTMKLMGLGPKKKGKAESADGNHADTKEHREKENTFKQDMLKLDAQALEFADKTTIDKQEEIEYIKLALKYEQDLDEVEKKRQKGQLTGDQAAQERAKINEIASAASLGIQANYDKKRQEEQNKVNGIMLESQRSHIAAEQSLEVLKIQNLEKLGLISSADAIRQTEALEGKKYKLELDELNKELALEGQKPEKIAEINAKILALKDKHAVDMEKISLREREQNMSTWDALRSGFQRFANEAKSIGQQVADAAHQMATSLSNGLGKAMADVLVNGASFKKSLQAMWKSLAQEVVQSLASMAARLLINKGIEVGYSMFKKADTAAQSTEEAAVATTQAATSAETVAALEVKTIAMLEAADAAAVLAAAETWASYADIPFVGEGLAIAQIAEMEGSMAAVAATAFATGGVIDGPTLALMGEVPGVREVVAPETDFKTFAADLAASVVGRQGQVSGYSSYGSALAAGTSGGDGGLHQVHISMAGAQIMDTSDRGMERLGNLVLKGLQVAGQRRGSVIVPGRVVNGAI